MNIKISSKKSAFHSAVSVDMRLIMYYIQKSHTEHIYMLNFI